MVCHEGFRYCLMFFSSLDFPAGALNDTANCQCCVDPLGLLGSLNERIYINCLVEYLTHSKHWISFFSNILPFFFLKKGCTVMLLRITKEMNILSFIFEIQLVIDSCFQAKTTEIYVTPLNLKHNSYQIYKFSFPMGNTCLLSLHSCCQLFFVPWSSCLIIKFSPEARNHICAEWDYGERLDSCISGV